MKILLLSIVCGSSLHAEPVVKRLDWLPACDGSVIEIITGQSNVFSVHAQAMHSSTIVEWTIHYLENRPISAEYRELSRGRISEGDEAGAYSGENSVKRIQTWRAKEGEFDISDEVLAKELGELTARAKAGK